MSARGRGDRSELVTGRARRGLLQVGPILVGAALAAALAGLAFASRAASPASVDAVLLSGVRPETGSARLDPSACRRERSCDVSTGCVAPRRPAEWNSELAPAGPSEYRRLLEAFHACSENALPEASERNSTDRGLPALAVSLDPDQEDEHAFAATLRSWNGDIFWAPASKAGDRVTRYGDEARAVFGPIPDGDCLAPGAVSMPLEVDGNLVDLRPNPDKAGEPLEFQHRDPTGKIVRWTTSIPRCDKPSLAGTVAFCGLNSRLSRVVRGNVEWLFFCRKSSADKEVVANPYWSKSDPRFAVYGVVGYNKASGEIVFFDGRKDLTAFDWSRPFVPPGGRSYADITGRIAASQLYDPTFQVPCHSCHDNKSPYAVAPHAGLARVGYFLGEDDPAARAFSLGAFLPEWPRRETAPFRIIGSAYTSTYSGDIARARTVRDPTGSCTGCHTLTTQTTGRRIAADAVGRAPVISTPNWAETLELADEKARYERVAAHRTAFAAGMLHPWMVPGYGNEMASLMPPLSAPDWERLSDCLWGAGGSECGYRSLYTACPQPESPEDGSAVLDLAIKVLPSASGDDRRLEVRWRYLNSHGEVPSRDDVRFDMAIASRPSVTGAAPSHTVDLLGRQDVDGEPGSAVGGTPTQRRVIQDISYKGHSRWTEPSPSLVPRLYEVVLPATCGRSYRVRLLPKRFCFDQSGLAYGTREHILQADLACS